MDCSQSNVVAFHWTRLRLRPLRGWLLSNRRTPQRHLNQESSHGHCLRYKSTYHLNKWKLIFVVFIFVHHSSVKKLQKFSPPNDFLGSIGTRIRGAKRSRGARRVRPLLHRSWIFAIENHLSLVKWPPLTFSSSSSSVNW